MFSNCSIENDYLDIDHNDDLICTIYFLIVQKLLESIKMNDVPDDTHSDENQIDIQPYVVFDHLVNGKREISTHGWLNWFLKTDTKDTI